MSDTVRRRAAFSMLPEWIIKADISAHAVRLYAALDRYAGLPKGAIPSRQTLADEWLHCSIDTVDRAKNELLEIGAMTVEKTGRNHNLYILEDRPQELNSRTGAVLNSRTGAVLNSRTGAVGKRASERELVKENPPGGPEAAGELVATVAVAAAPAVGAQQLVAAYCDAVAASGTPPPRRLVGMVAKQVGELLGEGIDPRVVARSLGLLIEKDLHPSCLATLVPEAARGGKRSLRFGRGLTPEMVLSGDFGGKSWGPTVDKLFKEMEARAV